jgi:hypothetical protein
LRVSFSRYFCGVLRTDHVFELYIDNACRPLESFGTVYRQTLDLNSLSKYPMIERYTIKFGPAVSQKELEEALDKPGLESEAAVSRLHKMKARIEVICDFEDLKRLTTALKELSVLEKSDRSE